MNKKRSGFSLIEIVIALVIMGILWSVAATVNTKHIRNTKISTTTQEEQLFATDMDNAIAEIGLPEIAVFDAAGLEAVNDFLSTLESEYINFTFDRATLKTKTRGFSILTSDLKDSFNQPFMFYVSTAVNNKRVMLCSAGADMEFSTATYATGDFKDDIITIIKER